MAGLDSTAIFLVVLPFILYVGYSELSRHRRREEEKAERHRQELKAEADDKLRNVYGPLLYRLNAATYDPARQKSKTDQCKYVLSHDEIKEINSILAANSHLVEETILNCWEHRFDGAKWTQWGQNRATGGPIDLVVGYAMDLTRIWQRTKAEYDTVMKQYQDNKD